MIDAFRRSATSWARALTVLLLLLPSIAVTRLWLDPAVAWMHPEAVYIAAWTWSEPVSQTTGDRLAKIAEQLEAEGRRPRILSVSTEIGEAVLRPLWTQAFGPHPSIAPLGLLTAIVSPILIFKWLRLRNTGSVRAAALTAVFLTSTFLLSVLIPYIRPAKKWTILWACLSFYLAERHRIDRSTRTYWLMILALVLAFFSDEEAYLLAPSVAMMYAGSLLRGTPYWQRALLVTLPLTCFVGAQYGLALWYASRSATAAPWDVFALPRERGYNPTGFLFNANFWLVAAAQTARNLLTMIGIYYHTTAREVLTVVTVIVSVVALQAGLARQPKSGNLRYQLVASTLVLCGIGVYLTVLDWWPNEAESQSKVYISSFGYYYRSSFVILLLAWLSIFWDSVLVAGARISSRVRTSIVVVGVVACIAISWSNLVIFPQYNRLIQLVHSYPILFEQVNADAWRTYSELKAVDPATKLTLTRVLNPTESDEIFYKTYSDLFGDDYSGPKGLISVWYENHIFRGVHWYYPSLMHDYAPTRAFVMEDVNYAGANRDRQRLKDLRVLQARLWAYHDTYGRFPCVGENSWRWSWAVLSGSWTTRKHAVRLKIAHLDQPSTGSRYRWIP